MKGGVYTIDYTHDAPIDLYVEPCFIEMIIQEDLAITDEYDLASRLIMAHDADATREIMAAFIRELDMDELQVLEDVSRDYWPSW